MTANLSSSSPQQPSVHEEMLYRALFEQTNDAVFILDLEGNYLTINSRAVEMFGYARELFLTLTFEDVVAEAQHDNAIAIREQLLAREVVPLYQRQFIRADGSTFIGEVNAQLVLDDNGDPLHIQSVVRDITERKQIEDNLYYHAHLLENVSDAIISTDMRGHILTWNVAAEKIYGWRSDDVVGKDIDDVLETSMTGLGRQEQVIKEQYFMRGHWNNEVVQKRRDGKTVYMLSSVSLLRDSGNRPVGMVIVNHDITARKSAEKAVQDRADQMTALRQVDAEITSTLELDQVLLFSLNASVSLGAADSGFIVLLEAGDVKQVHAYGGYSYLETKEDPLRLYGAARRVVKREKPEYIADVRNDPDYSPDIATSEAMMAFPLVSSHRIIGVMVLETNDRTRFSDEVFDFLNLLVNRLAAAIDNAWLYQLSRTQLDELQQLYTQVSKLEQLKTDMIRIASHDLRNPVGLINGYIELLRMDVADRLDETEMDFIDSISRSVMRMQRIIDDILSLERIQQVAQNEISEQIDLSVMVRKAVASHQPEAELNSISLIDNTPDDPIVILGDPAQLYEGLSNLISNAIKYTPAEGDVVVNLTRGKVSARVEVVDNGYGIPEDQQERLFEPFYRPKVVETQTIKGTGLGLHLVRNIVERHGGEVLFESVYGKGSTFGFRLPLASLNHH